MLENLEDIRNSFGCPTQMAWLEETSCDWYFKCFGASSLLMVVVTMKEAAIEDWAIGEMRGSRCHIDLSEECTISTVNNVASEHRVCQRTHGAACRAMGRKLGRPATPGTALIRPRIPKACGGRWPCPYGSHAARGSQGSSGPTATGSPGAIVTVTPPTSKVSSDYAFAACW